MFCGKLLLFVNNFLLQNILNKKKAEGMKRIIRKEAALSGGKMQRFLPVASCADGGSFLAEPPQKRTKKARL